MTTRPELRKRARDLLGGNIFKAEWLFALLMVAIAQAILSISGFTVILPLILTGPVWIGISSYFLGRVRGKTPHEDFGPLFDGFKNDIGGNMITGLLIGLYTMLWSLLFVIPGIVKSYTYSMAYYVKLDHPEYTATQAITESRKIMNGHKMELFLLDLSFIGWYIVGSLCFGIGTLWVMPYHYAARTEFYKELVGDPIVVTPEFDSVA